MADFNVHADTTPTRQKTEETVLGERFGKYRLILRLGSGASGSVYLADDTLLERRVALKILEDTGNARSPHRDRFILEARSAAKLDPALTVPVHEINVAEGRFYIAMEWMKGGSVQQAMDASGAIEWREAARWLHDACRALAAAHEAGMLHRDIKPGNLLLTEDRRVKLGDFGLVKLVGQTNPTLTALGGPIGTPSYMSPEQCQGEPLDERSDIYSLGATFYALLTGKPPYNSETSFGVMFHHCSSPVPDAREANPGVPESCAALIRRAMAKSPSDRYGSARELASAIEKLIDAPPAPSQPTRRWAPWSISAMVLAAVALAGGYALTRPIRILDSAPDDGVTKPSEAESASRPAPGPAVDPPFPTMTVIGRHRGAVVDIAFDASNELVYAAGRGGVLAIWDPKQPFKPIRLVDPVHASNTLSAFGYFPKRRRAVAGGVHEDLVLWDLEKHKVASRAKHSHGVVRAIDVAPDGRRFATGGDFGWNMWELRDDDSMVDGGLITDGMAVVNSIRFSTVQPFVASAAANGRIMVYNLATRTPVYNWSITEQIAFAFAKTRCEFAFSQRNGEIIRGSSTPRIKAATLAKWSRPAMALDFSPDRRVVAAAGESGDSVNFFDLERDQTVRFSTGRKMAIQSLTFSPDGKKLAVGNVGGEIVVANVPLDRLSAPTPKKELQMDLAGNLVVSKDQIERASKAIKSLFPSAAPETKK